MGKKEPNTNSGTDREGYIRIIDRSKYSTFYFRKGFETSDLSLLHLVCNNLIENPRHVIVNCMGVSEFSDRVIEMIHFLDNQLKFASRKVKLIYVSRPLSEQISASRFGKFLSLGTDLWSSLQDLEGVHPGSTETNFIKAFVHATMRTFYIQIQTQCWRGKIFVKTDHTDDFLGDVNGVIEVTGEKFSYNVVLSFPKPTFLKLVEKSLGEKITDIDETNSDSAAELLNIIFGQAKRVLNEAGAKIIPQFPMLIIGRNLAASSELAIAQSDDTTTKTRSNSPRKKVIVIPFSSDVGEFFVQIGIPMDVDISAL